MSKRRVFHDFEFNENGKTIEPISVGMVDEDGREYYAVNADMDEEAVRKHQWLSENVWPYLPLRGYTQKLMTVGAKTEMRADHLGWLDTTNTLVKPLWVIRNEVRAFLLPEGQDRHLELWAYYGAYDHVCLAQLWGRMIDLPKGVPMVTHELVQLWEQAGEPEMPKQENQHKAIDDARWNKRLFEVCSRMREER